MKMLSKISFLQSGTSCPLLSVYPLATLQTFISEILCCFQCYPLRTKHSVWVRVGVSSYTISVQGDAFLSHSDSQRLQYTELCHMEIQSTEQQYKREVMYTAGYAWCCNTVLRSLVRISFSSEEDEELPPLWSSGQGSWLQIRRPGFDSRHYQKKK
jgi:hypothetical protein